MTGKGRAALAAASVLVGVAAGAQGPSVLDRLVPGAWEIHDIGQRGTARLVCLRDPRRLAHLEHAIGACRRTVVSEQGRAASIRYVCPRLGNGVTRLSLESDSIVRIQTQGLVRGAPFDRDLEARRLGPCRPGLTASLPD